MEPPTISRRVTPFKPPAAFGLAQPQNEGRRALCAAVQYTLAKVKKRHWKARAMEVAIQSYQGQDGPQAAEGAINSALVDYGRGKWDEAQCPPGGVPPLAKGAIATVMR